MTYTLLSGTPVAESILHNELIPRVLLLNKKNIQPKCVVLLIGNNSASSTYVRQKALWGEKAGIKIDIHEFPTSISWSQLQDHIQTLNKDPYVHGILLQLPIPSHLSSFDLLNSITPEKDIDGFGVINTGTLTLSHHRVTPCTPKGILRLLDAYDISVEGKKIVILGRSHIVGLPLALLLLQKNATVTICHSYTQHIKTETLSADILISAIGKPKFVDASFIKPKSILIDVGINRIDNKLVGDIDFESVKPLVSAITPVPKGVGPMTVISLLENTILAAEQATLS